MNFKGHSAHGHPRSACSAYQMRVFVKFHINYGAIFAFYVIVMYGMKYSIYQRRRV